MHNIDESIERARTAIARCHCPELEHSLPAVLAVVAARRSSRKKPTLLAALVAAFAMFGVAAVAAPYVDQSAFSQMLFRGLSAATGRQIAPRSLIPVAHPSTDVRTSVLWARLSSVATMNEAWAMQDGVLLHGATADHGSFYLIALRRNATETAGILLPDGAFAHPIEMRSFQSRSATFQLIRPRTMSKDQESRLVSAAVGTAL